MNLRVTLLATLASIALACSPAALAAGAPPSPLQSSASVGSLTVQLDARGNTLVVTDASRGELAVYYVDGGSVRLIGVRRLDHDFAAGKTEAPPATAEPVPTADLPGSDPPSFPRPPKSVRVRSRYSGGADARVKNWWAKYDVPGSVAETFTALERSFKGWTVVGEDVQGPGRAGFTVGKETSTVKVEISPLERQPGWVVVSVNEDRQTH